MYKLTLFILTTACISYVVTQGNLFKKLREWITQQYNDTLLYDKAKIKRFTWWIFNEIINCPLCFGFWTSIVVYLAIIYNLEYLCYPFMGSLCSYMIYLLIKNLKQ